MTVSRIIVASVLLLTFVASGTSNRWLPSAEADDDVLSEMPISIDSTVTGTTSADEVPPPATVISSATAPATIYYTTNSSDPTTGSLSTAETFDTTSPKIQAKVGGMLLDTTNANTFTLPVTVIFSASEPATIYYSTNGTDPTTATTTYTRIETAHESAAGPVISGFDYILVTLGEDSAGNLTSVQSYTFSGP